MTALAKPTLIPPYGGKLVDLLVPARERDDARAYAAALPSIQLSERSICDLEMLATGAFTPLTTFMSRDTYRQVLDEMRLEDGRPYPVPVTLPVSRTNGIAEGDQIALRDTRNNILATMTVEEIHEWDKDEFATKCLGTTDPTHPLITEMQSWGELNISGPLQVIELPHYYDFPELRLTPHQVRSRLEGLGNATVVAFQTRNPLHRAHEELTKRAIETTGGVLLFHPVAGLTRPGDVDHYSRVRSYKVLTEKYYDSARVLLALVPLAMRFAGPREALWHAIIRRNYGADHLIVGRDHASPGLDSSGRPFYPPYAAQELVGQYAARTAVAAVPFREYVYVPATSSYEEAADVPEGTSFISLSGTEARNEYLTKGRPLPPWYMRPEVAQILNDTFHPRSQQGICVWFTGLSGAGKSTIAEILTVMLASRGRRVTLLDGDVVRTNLSRGLGFDRKGRETNIRRIGFVAAEVVRHGGVAVCAAISPYSNTRAEVRETVGAGNFVEVFVDTPLDICEQRDPKGMYARARRGEIEDFTGVDDVYEAPALPEIRLDTVDHSAEENARAIIDHLTGKGFIDADDNQG